MNADDLNSLENTRLKKKTHKYFVTHFFNDTKYNRNREEKIQIQIQKRHIVRYIHKRQFTCIESETDMGAQQVKEGRGASNCNPINTGLNTAISANNTNLSAANCPATNNSIVGGGTFGAGSSLRASRINKIKVPKEPKNVALNVFTEHNGKLKWSENIDRNRFNISRTHQNRINN